MSSKSMEALQFYLYINVKSAFDGKKLHNWFKKKNRRFYLTFEYDLLLLVFTVEIPKAYHYIKNWIFMSRDKIGNSFARVIPYIFR